MTLEQLRINYPMHDSKPFPTYFYEYQGKTDDNPVMLAFTCAEGAVRGFIKYEAITGEQRQSLIGAIRVMEVALSRIEEKQAHDYLIGFLPICRAVLAMTRPEIEEFP